MKRWPRLCAHIICESVGYATPALAARIVMDAKGGEEDLVRMGLRAATGAIQYPL